MHLHHTYNIWQTLTQDRYRKGSFLPAGRWLQLYQFPKRIRRTDRPISLLSVMGKIIEKIILHRIRWAANSPHVRATGFKHGSGTRDAISILLHDISTSRTRKRRAAAIYLDVQKAFELVNKDVLLSELTSGLHGRLLAWTADFLSDRRANAVFRTATETPRVLRTALPRGVLSVRLLQLCYEHFSATPTP